VSIYVFNIAERAPICHNNSIMTPRPPRAAYYLAQRQLELMRVSVVIMQSFLASSSFDILLVFLKVKVCVWLLQ